MADPKPAVGRIVHYVSFGTPNGEFGKACRAAVVTEVADDERGTVGLAVLNPAGQFFHPLAAGGCRHHEADEPGAHAHPGGTWHWPERV